jgi:hypothetical protein
MPPITTSWSVVSCSICDAAAILYVPGYVLEQVLERLAAKRTEGAAT